MLATQPQSSRPPPKTEIQPKSLQSSAAEKGGKLIRTTLLRIERNSTNDSMARNHNTETREKKRRSKWESHETRERRDEDDYCVYDDDESCDAIDSDGEEEVENKIGEEPLVREPFKIGNNCMDLSLLVDDDHDDDDEDDDASSDSYKYERGRSSSRITPSHWLNLKKRKQQQQHSSSHKATRRGKRKRRTNLTSRRSNASASAAADSNGVDKATRQRTLHFLRKAIYDAEVDGEGAIRTMIEEEIYAETSYLAAVFVKPFIISLNIAPLS